jgi:hypothetical protein
MVNDKVKLEVLNPRGEIEPSPIFTPAPRVTDLDGKRIGLYSNGKQGMDNFYNVMEELLKKRYPSAKITILQGSFEIKDEDAVVWEKEIDTFIYAVGD